MTSPRRYSVAPLLKCELCESMKDINWTCINCNQRLCNFCKVIHLKSKSSMGHTIRILEKNNEIVVRETKNQSKNIYCNIHPIEALQMYCEGCECPVCYSCATGNHQGHKFVKISDIVTKTKKDLTKCMANLKRNQITELESSLEYLEQNQNKCFMNVDSVISEIEDQAKRLKQEIDNIRDHFIKRLKQREVDYVNSIHQIENQIHDLRNIIKTSEEKLQVVNEVDLVKFWSNTKYMLSKFQPTEPTIEHISFFTKDKNQSEIEKLFGSVVINPVRNTQNKQQKLHVVFNDNHTSIIGGKLSPRNMKPELRREMTSTPHKVVEIMKSFKIQDEHFSPRH